MAKIFQDSGGNKLFFGRGKIYGKNAQGKLVDGASVRTLFNRASRGKNILKISKTLRRKY